MCQHRKNMLNIYNKMKLTLKNTLLNIHFSFCMSLKLILSFSFFFFLNWICWLCQGCEFEIDTLDEIARG